MIEKKISIIKREKLYKKNFEADFSQTLSKGADAKSSEENFYEPLTKLMTLMLQLEILTNDEKVVAT